MRRLGPHRPGRFVHRSKYKTNYPRVMVVESNLNEVVVLDQKKDDMLKVSEGGHVRGGMEEKLHLGKFTSTEVLRV